MQAYTAVPQGALVNIPEALPQGLLYRYKRISNISRQNMKIPPNNDKVRFSQVKKQLLHFHKML